MSRIRSRGTRPEIILRNLLTEMFPGMVVETNTGSVPGSPDCWLPDLKLAVFADGCFFHGCRKHFRVPTTNAIYWVAKIKRNRKRATEVNRMVRDFGGVPVRIWEHNLKDDLSGARRQIRRALKKHRSPCMVQSE